MSTLNPQQQKAARTVEGPLLILAGAGTGKTTVLMHRIQHMIKKGIYPENILAVTFTNKAAEEMRERIAKKIGQKDAELLWMSTFHSMCVKILRKEIGRLGVFTPGFSIYDSDMSKDLFKMIINDLKLNEGKNKDEDLLIKPERIQHIISSLKNEMVDINSLKNRKDANPYIDWTQVDPILKPLENEYSEVLEEVYLEYQKRMVQYNAIDFDDLIMHTIHMFLENSSILEKYQDKFQYIMIDEYQDTNRSQYVLVKLLASKYKNIAVVGDDSQSIYAFRGSDIRNILGFENDYPNAKVIKLEENYRSTSVILNAANQVISKNKNQYEKELFTSKEKGDNITVYEAFNEYDEAEYVSCAIKYAVSNGANYSDFTILYRSNYQSGVFETELRKSFVPAKVYGGKSFFDTEEIRDIKSYLQFIENPKDPVCFSRIINKPKRSIGKTSVDKILQAVGHEGMLSFLENPSGVSRLTKKTKEGLDSFVQLIKKYRQLRKELGAGALIRRLIDEIDYYSSFEKLDRQKQRDKKDHVKQLIFIAEEFENKLGRRLALSTFLEEVMLQNDGNADVDEDNHVKLMTIHASKGLEFPTVFVAGMTEHRFPASYATTEFDIEEERRLCYVAFTRAKNKLYLTYPEKVRIYSGNEAKDIEAESSRFIHEFEHQNVTFVRHKRQPNSYFNF